ncbi:MAG: hypothetical protein QOG87_3784 [Actinomycetota bacterium]|jgi:pseudaminic acid biosynthesis-associated methylase
MTTDPERTSEAARLEELWQGDFGRQYVERNRSAGGDRGPFWRGLAKRLSPHSVLEVGCNVGANLQHLDAIPEVEDLWGVDVNRESLAELHARLPQVSAGWAVARSLPFRDGWFDLVFTVAVLIHVPEDALPLAMGELVRCSRRHVLCVEYRADETVEVDYRGQHRAFFKRDYGTVLAGLFPELTLLEEGDVSKADGFDDGLGYWLFAKG